MSENKTKNNAFLKEEVLENLFAAVYSVGKNRLIARQKMDWDHSMNSDKFIERIDKKSKDYLTKHNKDPAKMGLFSNGMTALMALHDVTSPRKKFIETYESIVDPLKEKNPFSRKCYYIGFLMAEVWEVENILSWSDITKSKMVRTFARNSVKAMDHLVVERSSLLHSNLLFCGHTFSSAHAYVKESGKLLTAMLKCLTDLVKRKKLIVYYNGKTTFEDGASMSKCKPPVAYFPATLLMNTKDYVRHTTPKALEIAKDADLKMIGLIQKHINKMSADLMISLDRLVLAMQENYDDFDMRDFNSKNVSQIYNTSPPGFMAKVQKKGVTPQMRTRYVKISVMFAKSIAGGVRTAQSQKTTFSRQSVGVFSKYKAVEGLTIQKTKAKKKVRTTVKSAGNQSKPAKKNERKNQVPETALEEPEIDDDESASEAEDDVPKREDEDTHEDENDPESDDDEPEQPKEREESKEKPKKKKKKKSKSKKNRKKEVTSTDSADDSEAESGGLGGMLQTLGEKAAGAVANLSEAIP